MKIEEFENNVSKEEMEIDYYVPVSISFKENDLEEEGLYYYRFINKEYSFIEFKINSVSKKIVNVTVTSINDIQNSDFIFKLGTYPKLTLLLTYMSSNMRMSLLTIGREENILYAWSMKKFLPWLWS